MVPRRSCRTVVRVVLRYLRGRARTVRAWWPWTDDYRVYLLLLGRGSPLAEHSRLTTIPDFSCGEPYGGLLPHGAGACDGLAGNCMLHRC
jgi:hypothetical protein